MFARLKNLDDRIFDNITRIHRPVVNKIMVGASKLGNAGIVWWFVIILFLIVPAWRFSGLVVIFAIGLTSLMGEGIIKHAVKRIRPCTELDEQDKRFASALFYGTLVPVGSHGFFVRGVNGSAPLRIPDFCV